MARTPRTKAAAAPKNTDELAGSQDNRPSGTAALERIALKAVTARGDIRDLLVNTLKHSQDKRPFDSWSEAQQKSFIEKANAVAEEVVRQTVQAVAQGVFPAVPGTLKTMAIKDGFKLGIEVAKTEESKGPDLMHAVGGQVFVVMASHSQFMGERARLEALKDQPELLPDEQAAPPAPNEAPVFTDTAPDADPEPAGADAGQVAEPTSGDDDAAKPGDGLNW